MKSFFILLISVIASLQVKAQQNLIDSLSTIPSHPRLLMLPNDEQRIRNAVKNDETWRNVHNVILKQCDSLLRLPASERVMEGIRLDANRFCLYRVFYLCYAWRISRETKYLQAAKKEVMAICRFSDWNPSHYLDVAELTMAAAIGYDWLYSELDITDKAIIRNAILEKGILTSYDTSYHAYRKWLAAKDNWNQVCNTCISYGAMAIYENDPSFARKVINRSIGSIVLSMKAYEPDGICMEGYGYWGYGSTYNVIFLDGLQKMFGKDFGLSSLKGFNQSPEFIQHEVAPSGECFNYSDAAAKAVLQPAMFWFARKTGKTSLLWQERPFMRGNNLQVQTSSRFLPLSILWGGGINLNNITHPKDKMWSGQGRNPVVLMRTSWTDPNAVFVGLKGGSPSIPHGHMDAGSFVMEANGERWAMDFGFQNYNSLESKNIDLWDDKQGGQRWQVFRYNNLAHNTLTFNNREQLVKGSATVKAGTSPDADFRYALIDLSSVYEGQATAAHRGIALCNNSYVLVRDEVEAGDTAVLIRWSMLTPASVKITADNEMELSLHGKKLTLRVQSTIPVKMQTWATDPPPHEYDCANPGTVVTGFTALIPAKNKAAFNVFLLPENTKNVSPVKSLNAWKY